MAEKTNFPVDLPVLCSVTSLCYFFSKTEKQMKILVFSSDFQRSHGKSWYPSCHCAAFWGDVSFDKKLTALHPKGYRGSKLKANGYEKSTLYLVIRINTLESTCPWYMSSHQRYCVRSIWALNDCLMDDQLGTDLVGGRQRQNAIMIFFA